MYLSLVYSLNKVNSQDKFPTAFTLQMCVCACVRACVRACILLLLGGSAPGCPDDPCVCVCVCVCVYCCSSEAALLGVPMILEWSCFTLPQEVTEKMCIHMHIYKDMCIHMQWSCFTLPQEVKDMGS